MSLRVGAGKSGHRDALRAGGDRPYRLEIARRSSRKPGFDDVDLERHEGVGNFKLFVGGKGGAGRLLAVAKRGVEHDHARVRVAIRYSPGRSWWVTFRGEYGGLLIQGANAVRL